MRAFQKVMKQQSSKEDEESFQDCTCRKLKGTMRKRKDGSVQLTWPESVQLTWPERKIGWFPKGQSEIFDDIWDYCDATEADIY